MYFLPYTNKSAVTTSRWQKQICLLVSTIASFVGLERDNIDEGRGGWKIHIRILIPIPNDSESIHMMLMIWKSGTETWR